ncbi:hypothetical protein [Scatolibacter rhodanostii]|uniref:hypothetical protein n=1 Tax=Scatolibacter rhodanostii TaxID=2014781 RepID=UPI000C07A279|nr:hypothetical protein [Scatolibacter rhodanostii]
MKLNTVLFVLKITMKVWRLLIMHRKGKNIAKKVGVGLAIGSAVAAVGVGIANRNSKPVNSMKKKAGRAMQNVSEIIGDVSKMIG